MTASQLVSVGPSHHQVRDRPILTRCLPTDWAYQVKHKRRPGLLGDTSEALQGTGVQSLSQPQAPEAIDVIEQNSPICQPQDLELEALSKASLQASLAMFSGHTSNPQPPQATMH